jgi:hypothetical protein
MIDELKPVMEICQTKIEALILETYPTAVRIEFYRESDHGHWYNSVPDIYDAENLRLDYDTEDHNGNPIPYEERKYSDWWSETFFDGVREYWDTWVDNIMGDYGGPVKHDINQPLGIEVTTG